MWNLILHIAENAEFVCSFVYTYSDLLHENSIGGFSLMQKAVHVFHTACGCIQLLSELLFGRLHIPHKWL